jgi:hypothetical protein
MEAAHEAFEAEDARGIPSRLRTLAIELHSLAVQQLLGNRIGLPSKSVPAHVHGQQACSWLGNASARLHMIDQLPLEMRSDLNERAMLSNCYELRPQRLVPVQAVRADCERHD